MTIIQWLSNHKIHPLAAAFLAWLLSPLIAIAALVEAVAILADRTDSGTWPTVEAK